MPPRLLLPLLALALLGVSPAGAQNRVRTETILPQGPATPAPPAQPTPQTKAAPAPATPQPAQAPPAAAPPAPTQAAPTQAAPAAPPQRPAQAPPSALSRAQTAPEILYDLQRLPPRVALMRKRILEAARSGDLEKLVTVMQTNETMPIFTFGEEKNPLVYWRTNYPDSSGLEILAILTNILEAGYVHIDKGTPQEMFVWPYFAFTALKSLTPEQKVELFRIVTGSDYKEMNEFGAYIFYRLGISPDGTWHFFVSGD